jgi:HTH-type transcriptional regulator/antitoxin HigA
MMQGHGRSKPDMTNRDVSTIATHWIELDKIIFVPHTEVEYRHLVAFLDHLVDEVGEDETHPLTSLMELVGVLIERYEDEHVPELASEAEE